MNEKIGKIKLELLKEEFIKQITDSYTLNLSMVLLEDFEKLQQENKQLQERMEYLERSNNRREDTILEQRQKIDDLEENLNKLNLIP